MKSGPKFLTSLRIVKVLNPIVPGILFFMMNQIVVSGKSLYVDYSYEPNPAELLDNEVCILHPNSMASLEEGQNRGNRFFAYLSLVEVAKDAPYFQDLESRGVKLIGENPGWESRLIDIRGQEWQDFFVSKLAQQAVDRNFDGFFVDTLDSIQLLGLTRDSESFRSYEKAIVDSITKLKSAFPNKKIVINRGFDLIGDLEDVIDGVLIESVFFTSDIAGAESVSVDWATTEALVGEIDRIQQAGLETYVIDYVAPGDRESAIEAESRIRSLGCIPYIGTRKLDGSNVHEIPIARKILVVYGHDPDEVEEEPVFPGDTLAISKVQTPLEWMGYEFEYHHIGNGIPQSWNDHEYCGVVIDESLTVPRRYDVPFAKWLVQRVSDEHKVLFLGTCGFASDIAKQILFGKLGVTFKGKISRADMAAGDVTATVVDPGFMNYEVTTEPVKRGFEAVQGPEDARVLVGLEMQTFHGTTVRFEPVFLANWGGFLLAPYAGHQVSPEIDLSHVNPFKFLGAIWPSGDFPVPDVTTRQGLRAFYSHIDGDGFVSVGSFPGRPVCGEILHDELLRDLPFPVTVSVVEAEIRGHMLTQSNPDVEMFESVARKIFSLPHIEPASHSYSHPYVWDPADKSYYGQYKSLNLPLKLTARYPKIDLEREIGGSLRFIKDKLSGTDNPPKIFLWSGNCRPSSEALRLVREAGIENMNGGNTILSRRFPGLAAVAPKLIAENGEIQVFASNQNEFYYTDGWKGPFYHGFKKVIETFEMTESPRRLKPVNVYYHFYSAERRDSLSALLEIYDWCRLHELHLMTTSDYAGMVRDSHHTRISELDANTWRVQNKGLQQTFRIPANRGYPDLNRSKGVIGYRKFQDAWYIAADGSEEVIISLHEKEVVRPHLVSSTESLTVEKMTPDSLTCFNRSGIRSSTVTLGGLSKGNWVVTTDSGTKLEAVEPAGVFRFKLPPGETATVVQR